MKKLSLILICFAFAATGCTNGYRVYVNGYSQLVEPIKHNAKFYVSSQDPNSKNPIFDNQVKSKIEALLKKHNYEPVSDVNESEYVILFQIGSDSHVYYDYEPVYHSYAGFHRGYWNGYDFGYTTYFPYYDTYYDRMLSMKVLSRNSDTGTKDKKVVWVGEAAISTGNDDMRSVIDYLLAGCFHYFGADTSRQKSIVITEDDPDILEIELIR
jgi:hypothetical protein